MKSLAHVLCLCSFLMVPGAALAGPAEEANATVDRWSAAYTSNDPEAVVKIYTLDAILLGTVSPIISEGTEGIRKYFLLIKDSGNKNAIHLFRNIEPENSAMAPIGARFHECGTTRSAAASKIMITITAPRRITA